MSIFMGTSWWDEQVSIGLSGVADVRWDGFGSLL